MPITVRCSCGKTLNVKDEHAGKKVRCPACREVLAVPAPARSTPPPGRTAPGGANPCPGCGGELLPGAVICVKCGYDTRTGKKLRSALARESHDATPVPRRTSARSAASPREGGLSEGEVRAYRSWGWLIVSLCLAGAAGALVAGVATGIVTVHKGLPEAPGAQAWELLKPVGLLFGGAIAGAFLGSQAAKVLPK